MTTTITNISDSTIEFFCPSMRESQSSKTDDFEFILKFFVDNNLKYSHCEGNNDTGKITFFLECVLSNDEAERILNVSSQKLNSDAL